MNPLSASHIALAAFSTSVSSTGWRSVGELAITADFARRSLLLQRFGEITIARLLLVNKPRVLDRDHRLIGKGFKQFYLFVRERAHFRAADMNRSERLAVAE